MNPSQRHKARHFAMQALYQWEITKELATVIEEQFLEDQPIDDKTDKVRERLKMGATFHPLFAKIEELCPNLDITWKFLTVEYKFTFIQLRLVNSRINVSFKAQEELKSSFLPP